MSLNLLQLHFHLQTAWKVNLQPNFHNFICVGIIFPSFHAKQSRITPTEAPHLLFRYQRHEHMSQKKFFPVNMKISCPFSRFVGISLESWHLEQRINTDGAFRIFCHANRFKKYVAALTSQVHCVKNVVQHARIIHMPCLYFCAGTRKREGGRWLLAGHVILSLHARHVILSLHARHVIPSLHAQHAILRLHAGHVILSLHAGHVLDVSYALHGTSISQTTAFIAFLNSICF